MFQKRNRRALTSLATREATDPLAFALATVETSLQPGGGSLPTEQLIRAWRAAQLLTAASTPIERLRWIDAIDRLETRIAARCVCGDPAAVEFINEPQAPAADAGAA